MANDYDYYEKETLFKFTQQLISANPRLSDLTTDLADIPDFERTKYEYTIQVPAHKTSITVFATPEDETSVSTINGEIVDKENGLAVPLEGFTDLINTQDIEVLVTAEDGKSTQTYTITVEKLGGFVKGTVITDNGYGIHKSTVKFYRTDLQIDWTTLNSTDLGEYEVTNEIVTEEDGTFEIILPIGTYDMLIEKQGYLDYIVKEIEVLQQYKTPVKDKKIIAGDIIKDGIIDSYDKAILTAAYNFSEGTEQFNIGCDYWEDGVIDSYDKAIFTANNLKGKIIE